MLARLFIIGFQALIGFALFSNGAVIASSKYSMFDGGLFVTGTIVFILGIASFVAIPILLLSIKKGRKFILIVSAIQIGMSIYLAVFEIPRWYEIITWMGFVLAMIVILGSSSRQKIISR